MVREEELATWGNWRQPNLSRSHQLLLSLKDLEELLIAFPTVDGVTVNKDLIQELTHRFTANATLKAIVMAADAKMFEGNLWTVSDLSVAVSTDPSGYSLRVWHAVIRTFLVHAEGVLSIAAAAVVRRHELPGRHLTSIHVLLHEENPFAG